MTPNDTTVPSAGLPAPPVEPAEHAPPSAEAGRAGRIAWAVDQESGFPVYIGHLSPERNGAKAGCLCPGCVQPLLAVNAGKLEFTRRPHFRHLAGQQRFGCALSAARRALASALHLTGFVLLPKRSVPFGLAGLSGFVYTAAAELEPETVSVLSTELRDEVSAVLRLEDGRELLVVLVGFGQDPTDGDGQARIELQLDDPEAVALMSPEEILSRLTLMWKDAKWVRHWSDGDLKRQAQLLALEKAVDAIDWAEEGSALSPTERRQTILHRLAQEVLQSCDRFHVPGWSRPIEDPTTMHGVPKRHVLEYPDTWIHPELVELEVHFGHSIPDVVVYWTDESGSKSRLLVEVTVTNTISPARIERLSTLGWPVLEVDLRFFGGVVTRDRFAQLLLDELLGKHWLFHPAIVEQEKIFRKGLEEANAQRAAVQAEILLRRFHPPVPSPVPDVSRHQPLSESQIKKNQLLAVPAEQWAERYLGCRLFQLHKKLSGGGQGAGLDAVESDRLSALSGLLAHNIRGAGALTLQPLVSIVDNVLVLKHSLGSGAPGEGASELVLELAKNFVQDRPWQTIYLIAVRVYETVMSSQARAAYEIHRKRVVRSIQASEQTYLRSREFDEVLSLLFEELTSSLANGFGTKQERIKPHFQDEESAFLNGPAFAAWAAKNPAAASAWYSSPAGKEHLRRAGDLPSTTHTE